MQQSIKAYTKCFSIEVFWNMMFKYSADYEP